ncbi:hypothetical protein ETB97_008718 [Aspergillus alliaceus]|uniref:Uncharacterized protein n=1 Tax=Petromyces alliaceus TaxID=209559 RepID=A0A8H6ECE4_PETAA|nr:hypothetical protein ETB97_008718 [Aspergillus burnettii]
MHIAWVAPVSHGGDSDLGLVHVLLREPDGVQHGLRSTLRGGLCDIHRNTSSGDINGALVTECAPFPIPLDYTNEASNATLGLGLRRNRAANSRSRGSVFLNFGGPGDNGKEGLAASTGSYYDLIVVTRWYAHRGAGNIIRFSWYATEEERSAAATYPSLSGNASDVALGTNNVTSRVFANICYATQNRTGQIMISAFTARDHMLILDALGEDGLLRYWGLSSVLGATLASMFPERIDKIVLDVVANPHEFYQKRDLQMLADMDKVFTGFCSECVATPDRCPLARNRTASKLEALYQFVENSPLKTHMFSVLYFPIDWAEFSHELSLIGGDISDYVLARYTDWKVQLKERYTHW